MTVYCKMFLFIGLCCIFVTVTESCRFGDGPNCGFKCRCTNNQCDSETGECIESTCTKTLPDGYGWGGDGCRIGNVAFGKSATQLGGYGGYTADLAIDGNTWPYLDDPSNPIDSCAHPWGWGSVLAWWMVDLESNFVVLNITIINRKATASQMHASDVIQARSDKSDIRIGSTSDRSQQPLCKHIVSSIGDRATIVCNSGSMVGRYVSVSRTQGGTDSDDMNICEFIVMGHEYIDCSSCAGQCTSLNGCDFCAAGKMLPDCKQDCPPGYWGVNCANKCSLNCEGTCGIVTGACSCKSGFWGTNCENRCENCANKTPCNGVTGACTACPSGNWGDECTQKCSSNCDGDGTCNIVSGDCKCTSGFWGDNCANRCGQCANETPCDSVTGECTKCADERLSILPLCTVCPRGNWGDDCVQKCSSNCDGDGTCNIVSGDCKCTSGFWGDNCANRCGHCANETPCDGVTGECTKCADERLSILPFCTDCPRGSWGGNCANKCSSNCDGDGTCNIVSGTCKCTRGFWGANCANRCGHCANETPCDGVTGECTKCADERLSILPLCTVCPHGYWGDDCVQKCSSNCDGDGTCNIVSGTCKCTSGFWGDNCANRCGHCANESPCDSVTGECTKCADTRMWIPPVCTVEKNLSSVEVLHSYPHKGPMAGGTLITVIGKHIPTGFPIRIFVGRKNCMTLNNNSTAVIGKTRPLDEGESDLGTPLQVYLQFPGDTQLLVPESVFTIRPNPIIEDVNPKDTIIIGGTILTVTGKNLDSVIEPLMVTLLKHKKRLSDGNFVTSFDQYSTKCEVSSPSSMLCLTPILNLPRGFHQLKRRASKIQQAFEPIRRTRAAVKIENSPAGDHLEFYIGFHLDGVEDYQNFTAIDVYSEPVFFLTGDVLKYKYGERITFYGEDLDVGITVHDYAITIGKDMCDELELLSNSLSCFPPQNEPDMTDEQEQMNSPVMAIHVGVYQEHFAGYLQYTGRDEETVKDETNVSVYILVTPPVGILIIVVIVVVAVVCICKRRSFNRKSKSHEEFPNDI